jgi:hypothetical protein
VLVAAGGLAVAARPAAVRVAPDRLAYVDASPKLSPKPSPGPPAVASPSGWPAAVMPTVEPGAGDSGGPSQGSSSAHAQDARPDSLLALRLLALDQGVEHLPPGERGWVSAVRIRGLAMP